MGGIIFSHREKGSALISALWTISLLALVVHGLSYRLSLEARLADYFGEEVRLIQAARAGIVDSAAMLREQAPDAWTAPKQGWFDNPERFAGRVVPEGTFDLTHQRILTDGRFETLYGMTDETAKININHAPLDVLVFLFPGQSEIAAAIWDWRDADDRPLLGGAEKASYKNDLCRNGPFRAVEELLLVRGVTPEIFHDVENKITVYGSGGVNVNTAEPDVLDALGAPPGIVRKILRFRAGQDGAQGTEDDGVFTSAGNMGTLLEESFLLTLEEKTFLQKAQKENLLGVRADAFSLSLEIRTESRRAARRFDVVINPWTRPLSILSWREGPV